MVANICRTCLGTKGIYDSVTHDRYKPRLCFSHHTGIPHPRLLLMLCCKLQGWTGLFFGLVEKQIWPLQFVHSRIGTPGNLAYGHADFNTADLCRQSHRAGSLASVYGAERNTSRKPLVMFALCGNGIFAVVKECGLGG